MSKELKALERIKKGKFIKCDACDEKWHEGCMCCREHLSQSRDIEIIEKTLKAVDIINEKRVDALVVVLSKTYIEYNDMCEVEEDKLTKKEFKLIREVLK